MYEQNNNIENYSWEEPKQVQEPKKEKKVWEFGAR